MSVNAAREFLKRAGTDADFMKALAGAKSREDRIALVRQAGYDFTEEDFRCVRAELPDAVLKRLAAGEVTETLAYWCTTSDCGSNDSTSCSTTMDDQTTPCDPGDVGCTDAQDVLTPEDVQMDC